MIDSQQFKDDERRYFDDHLEEYLNQFCSGRWLAYKRHIEAHIRAMVNGPSIHVLDLGSGPMPVFAGLAKDAAAYVCADLAPRTLSHLVTHYPQCSAVLTDAEALPFDDHTFDLVIVFGLLHHLPDPARAMQEIRRVIRPRGLAVASEPSIHWNGRMSSPHERGLTMEELRALFSGWQMRLASYNHPPLELWAAKVAARVPSLGKDSAPLWQIMFAGERLLHRAGLWGWDYLLTARAPDVG